jgi:HD-GYP domain-containing protein (c-di-GMP phosphodiesterase class II)
VADAYQKLISGADGKALSPDQAEAEIVAGAGQRFHAGVVEAFAKIICGRAQSAGA